MLIEPSASSLLVSILEREKHDVILWSVPLVPRRLTLPLIDLEGRVDRFDNEITLVILDLHVHLVNVGLIDFNLLALDGILLL